MQWTAEAESAIRKVPFFVRKKVRTRVEREAREAGKTQVSLAEVKRTQTRYLTGMHRDVQGYRIEMCFGPSGCPNRAVAGDDLHARLEKLLESEDLLKFLKARVDGHLKFHHEFRISLADCPNACSQPQIRDVGIIGAAVPAISDADCSLCATCVETCRENALSLGTQGPPVLDAARCVACGQCVAVCPTGTIETGRKGYRVQLGGKLGRHPRLARELPGIYDSQQVLTIVRDCLNLYKARSRHGERFAELFGADDFDAFCRRYGA